MLHAPYKAPHVTIHCRAQPVHRLPYHTIHLLVLHHFLAGHVRIFHMQTYLHAGLDQLVRFHRFGVVSRANTDQVTRYMLRCLQCKLT